MNYFVRSNCFDTTEREWVCKLHFDWFNVDIVHFFMCTEPAEGEVDKGMLTWLKDNNTPISQVREYMAATAEFRREWIRNRDRSVRVVIEEFPCLLLEGMVWQWHNWNICRTWCWRKVCLFTAYVKILKANVYFMGKLYGQITFHFFVVVIIDIKIIDVESCLYRSMAFHTNSWFKWPVMGHLPMNNPQFILKGKVQMIFTIIVIKELWIWL